MRPLFRMSWSILWILLFALAAPVASCAENAIVIDTVPPEIKSSSVPTEVAAGTEVVAEVNVVDDVAVAEVTLRYRPADAADFASLRMNNEGNGYYRAVLPSAAATGPTVDYFFEARDVGGNTVMRGNASMPLRVTVLLPDPLPDVDDAGGTVDRVSGKSSYWKWVIAAAVVGALAAMAQGGGGDSGGGDPVGGSGPDPTVNATISGAPYPQP